MANSNLASVPQRLLPMLGWIPGYRREWLPSDFLAGIALWAVMVPEGMAYAAIKLPFDHHGRRVVVGQRVRQGSPDIFLGWGRTDERDFYVRQLSELKGGIEKRASTVLEREGHDA